MKLEGQTLFFACIAVAFRTGNTLSLSGSDTANLVKGRLQEALSSVAKKTTISPEIIIPEPSDPTALLLQSTEVTKLSHGIRCDAKGNAAFISGSINSVKSFCAEQETARGNFPGPNPVIYIPNKEQIDVDLAELGEAGVSGILYTILNGEEISSSDEVEKDDTMGSLLQSAIENGMQLIPEAILNPESEWDEAKTKSLLDTITSKCGSEPTAVLLTVGKDLEDNNEEETEKEKRVNRIPKIPKDSPITLGSIRAAAGGGRIGAAVQACKEAGFKGVVLRCDCLPGFRMNPDLEFVQKFWGAAIGDLKSTKSKNFNFRSKVSLERDVPLEWFNYQKNVMESGALGEASAGPTPLDTDNGDFQGF